MLHAASILFLANAVTSVAASSTPVSAAAGAMPVPVAMTAASPKPIAGVDRRNTLRPRSEPSSANDFITVRMWPRFLSPGQEQAAWQAHYDEMFNVDHSP